MTDPVDPIPLKLQRLDLKLAVCKLDPKGTVPHWALEGDFFSVTRTCDELSVVCSELAVPDAVRAEKGWSVLRVVGSMEFNVVGVLASLTAPVAAAKIGVFAISTFDTDYLLVKTPDFERAVAALRSSGHVVNDSE